MNMSKLLTRFRIAIVITALLGIMLSGCVIGHRTPPLLFRFTVTPPDAGTRLRVQFFLEHKETDSSTGITSFVPKGERTVSMASGSPSTFNWDAVISTYQGGIWQGRVRIYAQRPGAEEVYVGEATQQVSLPYEAQSGSTTRPFAFGLTPDSQSVSGFRITALG